MRNCVITVLGQKGAGKTQCARRLIAMAPRAIIIDRLMEHEGRYITSDPEQAFNYLAKNWRGNFSLVVRFRQDNHYSALFTYLGKTSQNCPTLPFSVLIEEEDFFAGPNSIEPALDYLYRYGRHSSVNLIGVARGDTDLHRSIIQNSDAVIAFRMHKFSKEMRERFTDEEREQLRRMQTLTPDQVPKKGVHYLVYPDTPQHDADPFAMWAMHQPRAVQAAPQPAPTQGQPALPKDDQPASL